MNDIARTLWRHPSAVLLAVQLFGVVLYPFMGELPTGRAMISLFALVVLLLAVRAVRATPGWSRVLLVLAAPVAVLTILEALFPTNQTILFWSSVVHATFYLYTSYGFIRYMFLDREVTLDELFATGATFTVVAWAFANLYVAIQILWPGSFVAAVDPEAPRSWMELLFLSFTTLTSTGLSDVIPVTAQARSIVMIEQVAGLMYVALVISRIVGLTIARERGQGS